MFSTAFFTDDRMPCKLTDSLYVLKYSKHPHIRTHDFGGQAD